MSTELCAKITELREQGDTYDQISEKLGCSKGTVAYHLNPKVKEKSKIRQRMNRAKRHPFIKKIELFHNPKVRGVRKPGIHQWKKKFQLKLESFCRENKMYSKPTFSVEDVIDKIGDDPKCYLTGDPIDIYDTKSYHFDHIKPVARGGKSTLDNLGVCTRDANMSKTDMMLEEYVELCKKVVAIHG